MRALVKAHAEPGLWLKDVPEPEVGINDVLIRVDRTGICGTDLHIHNWDAWAQRTIPLAARDRPRVRRRGRRGRLQRDRLRARRPGQRRGPPGLRALPQLHGRAGGTCARTPQGIGVNRTGAFAEYIALPMTNVWHHDPDIDRDVAAIFDPFGNAVAHRARVPGPRRGRPDHRRRADRHHGRRGRPPRGRAPRRDHRRQPAPARAGAAAWASPARWTCARRRSPTCRASSGMDEGFDIGLEMSGQRRRRCAT